MMTTEELKKYVEDCVRANHIPWALPSVDRIKNLNADKDAAIIEGLLILNESEKNRLYVSDSGCGPDGCVDFEIKDGYLSFFCNDVCLNRINLHNKTE